MRAVAPPPAIRKLRAGAAAVGVTGTVPEQLVEEAGEHLVAALACLAQAGKYAKGDPATLERAELRIAELLAEHESWERAAAGA